MHKGFTLVELMIVVIVIGILSTIGVPQFAITQERALDREAISTLGIIWAAERAYRMEEEEFYPDVASGRISLISNVAGDLILINRELRLSIPAISSWTYTLNRTGVITARRTDGPRIGRIWTVSAVAGACENPTCSPVGATGCFNAGGPCP